MSVRKDLHVINSLIVGVSPTKYTLPSARGTNEQVLQTDASGVVTWQTVSSGGGGSNIVAYQLTTHEIEASSTSWIGVASFAWDDSVYAPYTDGTIRFHNTWVDNVLNIRAYDVNNATSLGSIIGINTTGIKSFTINNPVSDTIIEIQVHVDSDNVQGVGTNFTGELSVDDPIMVSDNTTSNFGYVSDIVTNTSLFWGVTGVPDAITSANIYSATLLTTQTVLSSSSDATTVTGVGTNFDPEVSVSDIIMLVDSIGNVSFGTVDTVTDDTNILWTRTAGDDGSSSTIYKLTLLTQTALSSSAILDSGSSPTINGIVLEYISSAISSNVITYTRITTSDAVYNATTSDEIIAVDTTSNAVTVNLPQINTLSGNQHKKYFIVDEGGNASINNITIQGSGGDTIIGLTNRIIATDNSTVSLYSDAISNWVIF